MINVYSKYIEDMFSIGEPVDYVNIYLVLIYLDWSEPFYVEG